MGVKQQMSHLLDNQLFQYKNTLKEFVSDYAVKHGFRIAISRSNSRSITWKCKAARNCPFTINCTLSKKSDKWKLFVAENKHSYHDTDTCTHEVARDERIVHLCTEQKMKPRFILQRIRLEFPDLDTSLPYVYSTLRNYRKRQKRIS